VDPEGIVDRSDDPKELDPLHMTCYRDAHAHRDIGTGRNSQHSCCETLCRPLRRALVCQPVECDWGNAGWKELGYLTAPNAARAIREHDALCDALKTAGVELVTLPGFSVIEVEGSEIAINGGGGPTCLTRPLVRD
jgi:hypothetical protein